MTSRQFLVEVDHHPPFRLKSHRGHASGTGELSCGTIQRLLIGLLEHFANKSLTKKASTSWAPAASMQADSGASL